MYFFVYLVFPFKMFVDRFRRTRLCYEIQESVPLMHGEREPVHPSQKRYSRDVFDTDVQLPTIDDASKMRWWIQDSTIPDGWSRNEVL